MPIRKKILVLANSFKQGGRCIAGRFIEEQENQWQVGEWCRPILPDREGHDSIPEDVCRGFNPLDVVSIELDGQQPVPGQPENWLWRQGSSITVEHSFNETDNSLANIVDTPDDLWLDLGAHRPDAVRHTHQVQRSLYLVQPSNLTLTLSIEEIEENGQRRRRRRIFGRFSYRGHVYERIPVTDPIIFRIFSNQFEVDGPTTKTLRNGDRYWLTMSIGLPYGPLNCRYKFIAAIIDHSGYLQRTYR